ncbi:hypothetical protein ACN26Y_12290 [Micromonospora sp. WMMD558]|uniref:hypothetical protein n=1 Tax=unclassified Micromonospora TaxID=2617518 RepID=UPI001E60D739|nr:hypothetical protein [Micromonospora sp. WMMC415]
MARRLVVALLGPVAWSPPGVDPVAWRTALAEDVVDLLATLNEVETAVAVTPADRWLADAVVWPGTRVYEIPEPTVNAVLDVCGTGRPAGPGLARDPSARMPGGDPGPTGGPATAGPGPEAGDGPVTASPEQAAWAEAGRPAGADSEVPSGRYDQVAVIAGDAPDLPGLIIGKLLRPLTTRPVAVAPTEGDGPGLLGVAARLPVPKWLPTLDLDSARPAAVRAAAPRPGDLAVTPAWHRLRGPGDLARLNPALEGWDTTRALLSGAGRPG